MTQNLKMLGLRAALHAIMFLVYSANEHQSRRSEGQGSAAASGPLEKMCSDMHCQDGMGRCIRIEAIQRTSNPSA